MKRYKKIALLIFELAFVACILYCKEGVDMTEIKSLAEIRIGETTYEELRSRNPEIAENTLLTSYGYDVLLEIPNDGKIQIQFVHANSGEFVAQKTNRIS